MNNNQNQEMVQRFNFYFLLEIFAISFIIQLCIYLIIYLIYQHNLYTNKTAQLYKLYYHENLNIKYYRFNNLKQTCAFNVMLHLVRVSMPNVFDTLGLSMCDKNNSSINNKALKNIYFFINKHNEYNISSVKNQFILFCNAYKHIINKHYPKFMNNYIDHLYQLVHKHCFVYQSFNQLNGSIGHIVFIDDNIILSDNILYERITYLENQQAIEPFCR